MNTTTPSIWRKRSNGLTTPKTAWWLTQSINFLLATSSSTLPGESWQHFSFYFRLQLRGQYPHRVWAYFYFKFQWNNLIVSTSTTTPFLSQIHNHTVMPSPMHGTSLIRIRISFSIPPFIFLIPKPPSEPIATRGTKAVWCEWRTAFPPPPPPTRTVFPSGAFVRWSRILTISFQRKSRSTLWDLFRSSRLWWICRSRSQPWSRRQLTPSSTQWRDSDSEMIGVIYEWKWLNFHRVLKPIVSIISRKIRQNDVTGTFFGHFGFVRAV